MCRPALPVSYGHSPNPEMTCGRLCRDDFRAEAIGLHRRPRTVSVRLWLDPDRPIAVEGRPVVGRGGADNWPNRRTHVPPSQTVAFNVAPVPLHIRSGGQST